MHILHYEVPQDVNLNHYFEVMNSRGEQLEKHEIIKAKLCNPIKDNGKEIATLNYIWDACTKMNVYIQQQLNNSNLFGDNLDKISNIKFDDIKLNENDIKKSSIKKMMDNFEFKTKKSNGAKVIDSFQPIIDFPNFLLIVLKIYMIANRMDVSDFILDDKKLIQEFNKIKFDENFSKEFTTTLLMVRFLLDNYIVHHTDEEERANENPWKLEIYQKNTEPRNIASDGKIQKKLVHLLSMFEVTFSPHQRKNYLFYCLLYLFKEIKENKSIDTNDYLKFLSNLADKYFYDIYLNKEKLNEINRPTPNSFDETIISRDDFNLKSTARDKNDFIEIYGNGRKVTKGIQLFIFNYMDYIIWRKYVNNIQGQDEDRNEKRSNFFDELGCSDFGLNIFKNFYFSRTRKSLEHFYPQAKVKQDNLLTVAEINCFGNFAMIGSDANSSGSYWDPIFKVEKYNDSRINRVSVASLKFYIMMQKCKDNYDNKQDNIYWSYTDIREHQEKMLNILFE